MQLMDNNLIVPGGAIIADNTLMKVHCILVPGSAGRFLHVVQAEWRSKCPSLWPLSNMAFD
jgi:hypothetical protein